MAAEGSIRVEVCYAKPEVQAMVALTVPHGTTARQALERSGLARHFSEVNPDEAVLGIRGKRVAADQALEEGDRLEILRPLTADPKEARRRRAATKGVMKGRI